MPSLHQSVWIICWNLQIRYLVYSVATASYRLLPLIVLNPAKPVPPKHAIKFQKCFADGVVDVDPITNEVSINQDNLRNDTVTREVLRHPEFEGCVELKRVRDYFLCKYLSYSRYSILTIQSSVNIESESFYAPEVLLPAAIKVMRQKISSIREAVDALKKDTVANNGEDVQMD